MVDWRTIFRSASNHQKTRSEKARIEFSATTPSSHPEGLHGLPVDFSRFLVFAQFQPEFYAGRFF